MKYSTYKLTKEYINKSSPKDRSTLVIKVDKMFGIGFSQIFYHLLNTFSIICLFLMMLVILKLNGFSFGLEDIVEPYFKLKTNTRSKLFNYLFYIVITIAISKVC